MRENAIKELQKKPNGQLSERIALIGILALFGLAATQIILTAVGEQAGAIRFGNQYLAFSLGHGSDRLASGIASWIGYKRPIYLMGVSFAARMLMLCLLLLMSRYLAWINLVCCAASSRWISGIDFAIAGFIIRMVNDLRGGYYNLFFIHISRLNLSFDLVDFYLVVSFVVLLVWLILCELRYIQLKKQKTLGMTFLQKMKWEFTFTGAACKMVFIPEKKWAGFVEKYGYQFEENKSV